MTNYITDGFKIINSLGEEEIIQIPYNINNVLIKYEDLQNILETYNVKLDKINDIEKFREAFTHKSYCKKAIYPDDILEKAKNELNNPPELLELRENSYERMEFLGDRVLKIVVSMYLFYRYPKENEGFMTRLQTKIEDKTNLSIMSKKIGLGKYFLISKHIESMNGRNSYRIHEDVFEAFIGALFLSNGFEPCLLLIVNLLETLIDYSDKLYCDNNYKDALLRQHHIQEWTHPKYDIIYFEGPAHKRKYIVGIQKHNSIETDEKKIKYIGYGIGNSHKEGAQQAAKMALIIHGILKEDQYSQSDIYYPNWDKIENGCTNILSHCEIDKKFELENLSKSNLKQDKSNLNQEKSNLNQEKSNLKQDKSNLKQDKSNLKQEKSNLNQDKYNLNEDKYNLNEDKYNLNKNKYNLNEEFELENLSKSNLKQDKSNLNQDKYNLNEDKYNLNEDNLDTDDISVYSNKSI